MANEDGIVSPAYTILRSKKPHSSLFYEAYFRTDEFINHVLSKSVEGIRDGRQISYEAFKWLGLPYCDVSEQEKIAQLFETINRRIDKQQQMVDALKKYKRGLNIHLLSHFAPSQNRKLGEVCSIVGGGTPDTMIKEYWDGTMNWFTPSEVGKTKYVSSSERRITAVGVAKSSAKLLPKNTVLLTTRATLGEMSILQTEGTTNQGFQSLVAMETVLPEYIYYLQVLIKPWCEKYASGNTFREISKTALSQCAVPIPNIKAQAKVVDCLSGVDKHISSEESELQTLLEMKKSFMQQLFI